MNNKLNSNRIYPWLCILAVLLAYWPLKDNQFVDWDDSGYVLYNIPIRHLNLSSLQWMFTNFHAGYWIPLTWISLAVDFWIGRLEPWVYHLDNLLLHCANTALVFLVSIKFLKLAEKPAPADEWKAGATAFGAALLFGLHPLHVESVAWASERKDLLCGLFFLLSLGAYLDYSAQPKRDIKRYLASLSFFALALLSKPMAVSLPFIFLLVDAWPLGRLRHQLKAVLWEKAPFLAVAVAGSAVAIWTQFRAGAGWGLQHASVVFRLMNAAHSVVFYSWKMIYPMGLSAFYPLFPENIFSAGYVLSALLTFGATVYCLAFQKKHPYLLTAWLYYLICLAPTLGLLQVGNQAAADRFTYLPSLAPFLLVAALLVKIFSRWKWALVLTALGAAALLGGATFRQVLVWRNSVSLWENVLKNYPHNNLVVFHNLARAYEDAGLLTQALDEYTQAAGNESGFFYPHWGKGRIECALGRLDESLQEYKTALVMNPPFPPLHTGLAQVYEKKGMKAEALAETEKAVQLDPDYSDGYDQLGNLYGEGEKWEEAITALKTAHALDPDNRVYFHDLVRTYEKAGKPKEAQALYRELLNHPRSLLSLTF